MKHIKKIVLLALVGMLTAYCTGGSKTPETQNSDTETKRLRVVSLNSSVTETIAALGQQDLIVGVDLQSTFPENIKQTAKDLGHVTQMSFENLMELQPDLVLATDIVFATSKGLIDENLKNRCEQANIELKVFEHEHSREGAEKLIKDVAETIGNVDYSAVLEKINSDFSGLKTFEKKTKILFVYARNTSKIMVAGRGTPMGKLIELAGGKNAAEDLDYYQPFTSESLVEINPDYLVLSTRGLEAIEGLDALLKIPGVSQTNAGKNRKIITMDEGLIFSFGIRVGQAVKELNEMLVAED